MAFETMLTPDASQPNSDSFDDLLKSVPRPRGGAGLGNIEIGEFAQAVEITEMEHYGGVTEEHVERSSVVCAARECFQLTGQPLLAKTDRLLEMLTHSHHENIVFNDSVEIAPLAKMANRLFRRSLQAFDRSVVKATLAALCKRDHQLKEHLFNRFLNDPVTDQSYDIIAQVIAGCSNTPDEIHKKASDLLVRSFSPSEDGSSPSVSPFTLTELVIRTTDFSVRDAKKLLRCAENFERDEFVLDGDLVWLNLATSDLMRHFPQAMSQACIETLTSLTAHSNVLSLACEVLSEAPQDTLHLETETLRSLLSSEDPVVLNSALKLCSSLGNSALPFVYHVLARAENDRASSLSALKTLGSLSAFQEDRQIVERFFESEWRRLLEAIDVIPDARMHLAPNSVVDPTQAHDEELLLNLRSFECETVESEHRLEACIAGIGALAPYSDAMLKLFLQTIELPSPLIRTYVVRGLPKTGDIHKLESLFARLLETSPISVENGVIQNLVFYFKEDGVALLQDWFGITANSRAVHPVLSQKQAQGGIESLEYWQRLKAARDKEMDSGS